MIFNCSYNNLKTLEGSPEIIEKDFICHNNKLISFKGAPKKVNGNFNCMFNNNLTEKDIEWLKENCDIKGNIFWK